MQGKIGMAILMGSTLALLAAGAAMAAPASKPFVARAPQEFGTPPASHGSALGLAPLMTSTVTTTETLTPTLVPTTTVVLTSTLPPGEEKIAQAVSDYFGAGLDEVMTIHDQEHGWGQVFFVFAIAQLTGGTPEEILAMRQDGEGWGQIFMGFGLKPGNHGNNLGAAVTGKSNPNSTPTAVPSVLAPSVKSDSSTNTECKGNPENKGKGNPCPQPGTTPLAPSNSNGNGNHNGNGNGNGNNSSSGNGRGKSGK